jgi:BRCT domain type II-containing protein
MDPLDPILPGDYISNPFYSRDKSYTFTLAGEMELFSREELTNLIQEYGGSVAPEVGIKTDFLVLGEVPDRSQATSEEQKRRLEEIERVQKLAKQYGVPVMREVELVELFKY